MPAKFITTTSLLASLCWFFSVQAQARFFENWFELNASTLEADSEAKQFLAAIMDDCRSLDSSVDGSYDKATPDQQSPQSAQSRLCATVILQSSLSHNPEQLNLGTCSKFSGSIKTCCHTLAEGVAEKSTKALAEAMCTGVPSFLEYYYAYRHKKEALKKGLEATSLHSEGR